MVSLNIMAAAARVRRPYRSLPFQRSGELDELLPVRGTEGRKGRDRT